MIRWEDNYERLAIFHRSNPCGMRMFILCRYNNEFSQWYWNIASLGRGRKCQFQHVLCETTWSLINELRFFTVYRANESNKMTVCAWTNRRIAYFCLLLN